MDYLLDEASLSFRQIIVVSCLLQATLLKLQAFPQFLSIIIIKIVDFVITD